MLLTKTHDRMLGWPDLCWENRKRKNKRTSPITWGIYWYLNVTDRLFTRQVNKFNPNFAPGKKYQLQTCQ